MVLDVVGKITDIKAKVAFITIETQSGIERVFAHAGAFFPATKRVDDLTEELKLFDTVRVKAKRQPEKAGCRWSAVKVRLEDEWSDDDSDDESEFSPNSSHSTTVSRSDFKMQALFRMESQDEYLVAKVLRSDPHTIRVIYGDGEKSFDALRANMKFKPQEGDFLLLSPDHLYLTSLIDNNPERVKHSLGIAHTVENIPGAQFLLASNSKGHVIECAFSAYDVTKSTITSIPDIKRAVSKKHTFIVYQGIAITSRSKTVRASTWYVASTALNLKDVDSRMKATNHETTGRVTGVADTIVYAMSEDFGTIFIPGSAFGTKRNKVLSEIFDVGSLLQLTITPQKEHNGCKWLATFAKEIEDSDRSRTIASNSNWRRDEWVFTDNDPILGIISDVGVTYALAKVADKEYPLVLSAYRRQMTISHSNLMTIIEKGDSVVLFFRTKSGGEKEVELWFPVEERKPGRDKMSTHTQTETFVEAKVLRYLSDDLEEVLQDREMLLKKLKDDTVLQNIIYLPKKD